MNPNTYLVDPQDLSPIGKSIKSLHHEFQIPSIIKLQEAIRNDSNNYNKLKDLDKKYGGFVSQ